ncbi:TetR/AcrR family transcriptional regulator [Mycolicibacterium sp. S2-37]|uniref:TetR/AcrR family transcriptional regulator n=1 Tax=Mycolicibacterium sp. S2-37 TaxID=2810297 RepID=UPI001A950D6F|nr:TetR/AcrR family transcriptional regulator [Mycolicibacterium sp. S2-37]MBO0676500.1 TetR/AcrR family transcriptional regulator [Mycolicibacterium sp. S2-37]
MAQPGSVEERIGRSTLDLLRTGGPRSVTVEAVAAASGVAKTTIYRRYSDRREMLSDALSRLAAPVALDPQTTPPDRLRWLIRHAVEAVEDGVGLGGVAAMLTADDPEFTAVFRRILVDQRSHLTAAVEAGKADGSLRADVDGPTLLDAVVGAYIAEYARSGGVAEGWEQRLFALFWPAIAGSSAHPARR